MSVKQISVFLENKPGTLSEMTGLLAEKNLDIRALSLAETKDFGIARMIMADTDAAVQVLQEAGFLAMANQVLAYAVPDTPGGLNSLLSCFNRQKINIEYMYSSLAGGKDGRAHMIFRVSHTQESEAALSGAGLTALTQEELGSI